MAKDKVEIKPIFVDDDLEFINTIKQWQEDFNVQGYATTNIDESLYLVRKGDADIFICDLKMPWQDGISVIQNVRAIDPNIELAILTGYELTDEQNKIVKKLGAKVYLKYEDLEDFLNSLVKDKGKKEFSTIIQLQERISKLEHLNRSIYKKSRDSRPNIDSDDFAKLLARVIVESFNTQLKQQNKPLSDFQKAIFRSINFVISVVLAMVSLSLAAQYVDESHYLVIVFLGVLLSSLSFFELIGRFVLKCAGFELSVKKSNDVST